MLAHSIQFGPIRINPLEPFTKKSGKLLNKCVCVLCLIYTLYICVFECLSVVSVSFQKSENVRHFSQANTLIPCVLMLFHLIAIDITMIYSIYLLCFPLDVQSLTKIGSFDEHTHTHVITKNTNCEHFYFEFAVNRKHMNQAYSF